MRRYSPKIVAGLLWNPWPGSRGMGGRDQMESLAGIAWNSQLCGGYCNHLLGCPRFAAQEAPDMAGIVEDLQHLQAEEKSLKAKIEPMRKNLLTVVETIGSIKVNNSILGKRSQSRKSLNIKKLEAFLTDVGQSISDFQESGAISSWLDIKKCKAA